MSERAEDVMIARAAHRATLLLARSKDGARMWWFCAWMREWIEINLSGQ